MPIPKAPRTMRCAGPNQRPSKNATKNATKNAAKAALTKAEKEKYLKIVVCAPAHLPLIPNPPRRSPQLQPPFSHHAGSPAPGSLCRLQDRSSRRCRPGTVGRSSGAGTRRVWGDPSAGSRPASAFLWKRRAGSRDAGLESTTRHHRTHPRPRPLRLRTLRPPILHPQSLRPSRFLRPAGWLRRLGSRAVSAVSNNGRRI